MTPDATPRTVPARRLRVHVGERDKDPSGRPLWEAVLKEARARGLAGATVVKGVAGFGARSRLHTAKILRLSEDLPLVVEIVDEADRIAGFQAWLATVVTEGLVTVEDCEVVRFGSSPPGAARQPAE